MSKIPLLLSQFNLTVYGVCSTNLLCVNNEDNDDYDLDVSDDMKKLSDIDEHPGCDSSDGSG